MKPVIEEIRAELVAQGDDVRASFSPRFFKAEPGDIDQFLGVTVPKQRIITKKYFKKISPEDVEQLLHSEIHEDRLTALMMWVLQYKTGEDSVRTQIYNLYLKNTRWINNWDLVDTSARDIVGAYLYQRDRSILSKLSKSEIVWERRIAIIATFYFIQRGDYVWTLKLAEQYLDDTHHYIHKATGWMLREMGKRDESVLRAFLDEFVTKMPRTTLRYAIERLDEQSRKHYLALR